MAKIIKIIGIVIGILAIYFIGGILVSRFVVPQTEVDLGSYFKPGDRLFSRFEGFDQTVVAVENGMIRTRLEVRPHAAGPPEHFHEGFAELFTVTSGTLSILVNGEKRTLSAGESITIPPMTRHKPFNETDQAAIVESGEAGSLPLKFGYALSQLYGFMDQYPDGPGTWAVMMQLAVLGNEVDTWIADGPPLMVQKAMRIGLAPTARLLGYRSYYEEYRPRH
jgi:hypothetical protein